MIRSFRILFLLAAAWPGLAVAEVTPPKNPNSAKGCAICHYRWIDTFFIQGKGTALVPYQSRKVVATAEMCFSCHDGSIKDSRDRMNPDTGHRINRRPPDHMQIPEIFPLDEDGRMQCATCHTAHGVPSGAGAEDTIFMRTSNRDSAMCRMCHPQADGGPGRGNHPIGKLNTPISEELISEGAMTGSAKNQAICQTCHTAHGSPYDGMLVLNGGNSDLCLACHQDKAIFSDDGRRKPFHVINVAPRNARIPAALFEQGAKLGDNDVLTCQTCHKVHQNRTERHLLLIRNEKSQFCFTCHADKASMLKGRHNLARSAPKEKNHQGQTIAQAGVCSACHLPHRPARKLSGQKDFTTQLCTSCHTKGEVAGKVNLSGNNHPLAVDPFARQSHAVPFAAVDAEKESLSLPLFNVYGVQDRHKGLMTCATCHNPHGSQTDQISPEGNRGLFFLRKSQPQICVECHAGKITVAQSRHNLKVSAPQAVNLLKQKPAQSGICGSCHLVHGSHRGFLWAREIKDNGDGIQKGMCVTCHHDGGIAAKKVNQGFNHPLNLAPSATGITTRLPLYDHQARRSKTGAIRCATCHDPHRAAMVHDDPSKASGNDGPKNRFLRLPTTPSPALCIDCHVDAACLEKTDHDLSITAPASVNHMQQTPAESGPCGACHLVHSSRQQFRLWARDLGEGRFVLERMCNGCHAAAGPAADKVPLIASHPKSHIVAIGREKKGRLNYFPVFDTSSPEPVAVGNITCPSCHQVHRWRSEACDSGAGLNMEGNVGNSFLRSTSYLLPCKECHGADAIYKYGFFHDVDKRTRGIQ